MSISDAKLCREVKYVTNNDGRTVLLIAALTHFPLAALSRLVQCGCDINAKDKAGNTAIIKAIQSDYPAIVDSLALLGADLSVKADDGRNILQLTASSKAMSHLWELHGLKEGEEIAAGFVSPLKGMPTPMIELHNKSIMKLTTQAAQCIRIMSLEMHQLRVEARERNEKSDFRPIMERGRRGRERERYSQGRYSWAGQWIESGLRESSMTVH
jgi:hypothetical protein